MVNICLAVWHHRVLVRFCSVFSKPRVSILVVVSPPIVVMRNGYEEPAIVVMRHGCEEGHATTFARVCSKDGASVLSTTVG